jgi:hypothetical protein
MNTYAIFANLGHAMMNCFKVRLEQEIQRAQTKKKAQEFTAAYLESDPLRKHMESIKGK